MQELSLSEGDENILQLTFIVQLTIMYISNFYIMIAGKKSEL